VVAVQRDGYGQRPDGGPYQGWGQGRPWPLLTGERAHYELAAGNGFEKLIRTYEAFATCGQMLRSRCGTSGHAGTSLRLGMPAGSAVPLVWAHAEYLKLLRSALDGKVFDRVDAVLSGIASRRVGRSCATIWKSTASGGRSRAWMPEARCEYWTKGNLR